jgi:hypothetical protein
MSTARQVEVYQVEKPFESRWGYHPCDYQTFLKLKAIHKWHWQTVRDYANWQRWSRKQPQNRVIRRWKRENGIKVGYEIVGPRPEPQVCDFLRLDGWYYASDYEVARMPRKENEVRPLSHTVDEINQMYFRCKEWFENR